MEVSKLKDLLLAENRLFGKEMRWRMTFTAPGVSLGSPI